MKNLLFLLLSAPLLFSCKKEKQSQALCFDGVVRWTGDPADGLGWAIFKDDSTASTLR